MLDFAENFQYVLQDENQSFHWSNSQCSIQPAVVCDKDGPNMSVKRSHLILYQKI